MPGCVAQPAGAGIITNVSAFVDCQTEIFVLGAYQSLASPGSTLSVLLTGFLTIAIAFLGYNLLLGNAPSLRTGTMTMAKVGAVLALATSWPAYHALVYDLAVNGPDQIASELGRGSAVPGSDGTLRYRLDASDAAMVQLAIAGTGPVTPEAQASAGAFVPPPPFAGFNALALGSSRIIFLVAALGSLVAIRVVAGLALALGPFFIALLLFSQTRSLFEGWVRVLAGAALASLIVFLTLGLELALIEPWLAQAVAIRAADQPLPSMPSELLVIVLLFGLVLAAGIFAAVRLAGAFRLPPLLQVRPRAERSAQSADRGHAGVQPVVVAQEARARTRSADLADHLNKVQARESALASARGSDRGRILQDAVRSGHASATTTPGAVSGGRLRGTRRTNARETASARRRDTKA